MKIPFRNHAPSRELRKPAPAVLPDLSTLRVGARYRGARVGGDFFDFVQASASRMLLLLLDIAGKREEALHIAASVQDVFRAAASRFVPDDVNEPVALTSVSLEINRTIMEAAGGVRCAPGFLACYNEAIGTFCYINAGHIPALLKHGGEITTLEASGLPLGLFSHATHDANICALPQDSVLVMVSRGLVEVKANGDEFGLDRVRQALLNAPAHDPEMLCQHVLETARGFLQDRRRRRLLTRAASPSATDPLGDNDTTALALVRSAAALAATAR